MRPARYLVYSETTKTLTGSITTWFAKRRVEVRLFGFTLFGYWESLLIHDVHSSSREVFLSEEAAVKRCTHDFVSRIPPTVSSKEVLVTPGATITTNGTPL